MEMSSANEIRYILNEIDEYKKKLKDIKDCTNLRVTINDEYNGLPCTYERNSMEVRAIIDAYENHIEVLCHRIAAMI
jgi:hypothetical protein